MSSLLEKTIRELPSDFITAADIAAILPVSGNARYAQIKRALAKGDLIRLRRGVYRRAGYLEKVQAHPFEVAHYLYWPSYISLESALSFHGLIPEAIYNTTCVTTQRSKSFENFLGIYDYKRLPEKDFFIDVKRIQEQDSMYFMANPWKALCDFVYCYNKKWKGLKPAVESLRLDLDDMPKLNSEHSKQLIQYYSSSRITVFLEEIQSEY